MSLLPYKPTPNIYQKVSGNFEKGLFSIGLLSSKQLCLPDFLGIGTPQSGTTWLHQNLSAHPEIFITDKKELHYFDRVFHMRLKDYSSIFTPGEGKVKGEITPDYSILRVSRIRFIRKIMPDVRLILIIRNPIERAWSAARRIFSRKQENFLEGANDEEIYNFFKNDTYKYQGDYEPGLNRGHYTKIIDNWLGVFPGEQLLIGWFEDIIEKPEQLLSEIFEHLGVSRDVEWSQFPFRQVINKNPAIPLPEKYRIFLLEIYSDEIEALIERYGERARPWLNG